MTKTSLRRTRAWKRTSERVEEICRRLEEGESISSICANVGIHPDTYRRWSKIDEDFSIKVKRSLARYEMRLYDIIHAASVEHWRAAAWLLERKYPERYSTYAQVGRVVSRQDHLLEFIPQQDRERARVILNEMIEESNKG